jgi:hypothetical protein
VNATATTPGRGHFRQRTGARVRTDPGHVLGRELRHLQSIDTVLKRLASEHADRIRIATVRLADHPALAYRHQIMALPTLIVFSDGQEAKRITDVATKAHLTNELATFLA